MDKIASEELVDLLAHQAVAISRVARASGLR